MEVEAKSTEETEPKENLNSALVPFSCLDVDKSSLKGDLKVQSVTFRTMRQNSDLALEGMRIDREAAPAKVRKAIGGGAKMIAEGGGEVCCEVGRFLFRKTWEASTW